MSDQQFDINAALGETYEYGSRTVLPASYYPVILSIGETGTSDAKMQELKVKGEVQVDESGQVIMVEGGETPFIEVTMSVYEGAFSGEQVTKKLYITPGRTGSAIGRWLGACQAITGQSAQTAAVCQRFGIAMPTGARATGNETADQAYKRATREALADGFYAMDAAKRLAFVAALMNVVAWEGKRAIVKIGIEDYTARDGSARSSNVVDGFLPLQDPKKGLAWVRLVELPKQEATKAVMDGAAS